MVARKVFAVFFSCLCLCSIECSSGPSIDVWYGKDQHFGRNGQPQKWVNILGRVDSPLDIAALEYSLNESDFSPLSIGPDGRRLANAGDFNIEIGYSELKRGPNTVSIRAVDSDSERSQVWVNIFNHDTRYCALPYKVNWSEVKYIQDKAQIVDGKWQLAENGIRVLEPYYDRVIAFGDRSWSDYEVVTTVTFHGMRVPVRGRDGGANVIHAAIAARWPGHDEDGKQPRVKWYPLGATAEFRINPELKDCSWRILGGGGKVVEARSKRDVELNVPYKMKHRVEELQGHSIQYSVKLWKTTDSEPETWDAQAIEGPEDVKQGGALLLAHYADVTFGNVEIHAVR